MNTLRMFSIHKLSLIAMVCALSGLLFATATHAKTDWLELRQSTREFLVDVQPVWGDLTDPEQRQLRKMADHYRSATPEQQAVMRQRVKEWARLTPEQKRLARENYKALRNKETDHKVNAWSDYQTLDEDERKRLSDEQRLKRKQTQTNPALPPGAAAYTR